MLINPQLFGNRTKEFQRMKPSLLREPDCSRHGKRQRQTSQPFRFCPNPLQRIHFQIQRFRVLTAIQETVLILKITIYLRAKLPIPPNSVLICPIILPCAFCPESAQELFVEQTMLSCDFRGCPGGNTGANPVRLHQYIINSPSFQLPGAENSRDSSPDNQYIGLYSFLQLRKRGQFRCILP